MLLWVLGYCVARANDSDGSISLLVGRDLAAVFIARFFIVSGINSLQQTNAEITNHENPDDDHKLCDVKPVLGVSYSILISSVTVNAQKNGAPGAIPTRDLPLRRRTLYAAELREHEKTVNSKW